MADDDVLFKTFKASEVRGEGGVAIGRDGSYHAIVFIVFRVHEDPEDETTPAVDLVFPVPARVAREFAQVLVSEAGKGDLAAHHASASRNWTVLTVETLVRETAQRRSDLDRRIGELQLLSRERCRLVAELEEAQSLVRDLTEVSVFLTAFGEEAQAQVQAQIEVLVTHALRTIFGDDLSFRMVPSVKGKFNVIDFEVVSDMDGVEVVTPVLGARGGGVAAVIGFLLRLVLILLTPGARRLIVLDETFAQVSAEYEGRVAEFLRELVDKAGVQVILVTHSHAYSDMADRAYRFRLDDGVTKVEET